MTVRITLALCALATAASTADAQTMFLKDGSSGFGVNVGVLNAENASGFGGTMSLSSNGLFDLGLGINRYDVDVAALGGADVDGSPADLRAIGIAPKLNVHVFRQSAMVPVSVMATGSYEWVTYAGDLIDDLDMEMTGASYEFGGALYSRFAMSPVLDLIPTLGVRHVENSIETTDALGAAVSRDDTGTTFSVTPSLGLKLGPVNVLNLNPTFEFGDNRETTFELTLGLAIPTGL